MGNRWYVSLDGKELGPLSDSGLERMIQNGRVDGDALVRDGRTGARTAAREIERQIAARPARQRPGQEAIDRARGATPPRPPAPASKISPSQFTRSPATSLAAATAPAGPMLLSESKATDSLPPPDDLPLEEALPDDLPDDLPLAADSNSPSTPVLPEAGAAGPAASPAILSARRSPAVLVGVGAGATLILAVSFAAGWFALRGVSPQTAAAPQSNPPAGPQPLDPQLAALQQQAEQLRREMAEAKQKLKVQGEPLEEPQVEASEH